MKYSSGDNQTASDVKKRIEDMKRIGSFFVGKGVNFRQPMDKHHVSFNFKDRSQAEEVWNWIHGYNGLGIDTDKASSLVIELNWTWMDKIDTVKNEYYSHCGNSSGYGSDKASGVREAFKLAQQSRRY